MSIWLPISLQMTHKSSPVGPRKLLPNIVRYGTQGVYDRSPAQIRLARGFDMRAEFTNQQTEMAPIPQEGRRLNGDPKIVDLWENPSAGKHADLTSRFLALQRQQGIHCREAGPQEQHPLAWETYPQCVPKPWREVPAIFQALH